MMKLSDHISALSRLLEENGDIPMYSYDGENDVPAAVPEVARLMDGEVVYQHHYDLCVKAVKTEDEQRVELDRVWATLTPSLVKSWISRENFGARMSISYIRARRIVNEWDTLPRVVIL